MKTRAPAKLNLALVVGPRLRNGRHEVTTLMSPVALADELTLERRGGINVSGYADDTLVRDALEALARAAGVEPGWHVTIEKAIPVASGLGGGSSDAAAALLLANDTLERPLPNGVLHDVASELGADVPFFLSPGPKVAVGDGTQLRPVAVPRDHAILLLLPHGASKPSTGAVYDAFDARDGALGFDARRAAVFAAVDRLRTSTDLAALPPNDLASSDLASALTAAGAFRADVTGAGPMLYGLFRDRRSAESARASVAGLGRVWITEPAW